MNCPICFSATAIYCEKMNRGVTFQVRRCRDCGHAFVANRPALDELAKYYVVDNEHDTRSVEEATLARNRKAARLARRIAALADERGPVLDVGCANGVFSYHLQRQGFGPCWLIDLDPRAVCARDHLDNSTFETVSFEDFSTETRFQAIVMSQVLEHSHDPSAWLVKAESMLEEGGVLAVAVPNFGGLYRLFGSRDPMICPPIHLNHFTANSLQQCAAQAGLDVVAQESESRLPLHTRSMWRQLAFRSWNPVAGVFDRTTYGISLHMYFKKSTAAVPAH